MYQRLIKHPKLSMDVRSGTEGPRHDPYHFERFHIETPRGKLRYHRGLGVWAECDGVKVNFAGFKEDEIVSMVEHALCLRITGYTFKQLNRIAHRLSSRCLRCGCKHALAVPGFPGETLFECERCKHIVGSFFCESAVI